nr:immunoglobulin heavy chain junction region [Macaca mulatta]
CARDDCGSVFDYW